MTGDVNPIGSPTIAPAATRPAAASRRRALNLALGVAAAAAAFVILLGAASSDRLLAVFWLFGLAFGFVLQRSRFCFASAFRDLFLLRHGRSMRGVLAGLAVATVGFAMLMARQVPNPSLGIIPPSANVLPIGWHLVVGGLLFGV